MRARRLICVLAAAAVVSIPLRLEAQTTSPGAPPAATIVQPPPAAPETAKPSASPASPSTPAPTASSALPTLAPNSSDPGNADEVVLPEKPVLILTGSSSWDDGLKTLRGAFAKIDEQLSKLGIAAAGRPVTVFLQTTDDDFHFDAMVPIAKAPDGSPALAPDMRFGTTPSGKAYRFVHKGPYSDIDSTYETITAYLDSKDIVAKDAFIEEYLNDVSDPADPALEINIYVQPK